MNNKDGSEKYKCVRYHMTDYDYFLLNIDLTYIY